MIMWRINQSKAPMIYGDELLPQIALSWHKGDAQAEKIARWIAQDQTLKGAIASARLDTSLIWAKRRANKRSNENG